MALADLVAAGSDAFAARRYDDGEDWRDVVAALRREFPTESLTTIYAAANRGREAWVAGTGFAGAADDYRLPASEVPRALPGMTGWQYSALVFFGPPGGNIRTARTVVVSSQKSVSRGELRSLLAAAAHDMLSPDYGGESKRLEADKDKYLDQTVIGVTRV